jgi:hypothetical protein
MNGKALCLIWSKGIAVLKEYNVARHYTPKKSIQIVSVHWEEKNDCFKTGAWVMTVSSETSQW